MKVSWSQPAPKDPIPRKAQCVDAAGPPPCGCDVGASNCCGSLALWCMMVVVEGQLPLAASQVHVDSCCPEATIYCPASVTQCRRTFRSQGSDEGNALHRDPGRGPPSSIRARPAVVSYGRLPLSKRRVVARLTTGEPFTLPAHAGRRDWDHSYT